MSKNRDGKPTAFQVAALEKAGIAQNSLKNMTYRDAENALKRLKRAAWKKAKAAKGIDFIKKAAKVKVAVDPKRKSKVGKQQAYDNKKPVKNVEKKPVKRVAGVGVFRVRIDKADVIEALLIELAKTILAMLEGK